MNYGLWIPVDEYEIEFLNATEFRSPTGDGWSLVEVVAGKMSCILVFARKREDINNQPYRK